MWKKIKPYVLFIGASVGAGALAAWLTGAGSGFYDTVKTPPLAPPPILFPVVWTVLYVLLGVGAATVYRRRNEAGPAVSSALTTFGANLILNVLWCVIFFNFRAFLIAFLWLIILWIVTVMLIRRFLEVDRKAALLQIPYLVWITFAG